MIQRTAELLRLADLHAAAADVLRPEDVLSPSEWAERYREVAAGPFRGTWDNANGPHLVALMDAVREALLTGRDLVVMKGAQEGVTEALGLNAVAWLLHYYGGPILYLTAKDDTAKKLSRQRWEPTLKTCEPLRKKHLAGKVRGEMILSKRFTDGSLDMCGSKSMNNFISNPYAIVIFDELDASQALMPDGSCPVATIRERLTAFAEGRDVLLIAFAHPTTKDRGAARLYYDESDQRRAHVRCPHCKQWMAPLWRDVKVIPRPGQLAAQAERDPTCYELVAPCCGVPLSDADRLKMIEHVEQRSTLPPEVAITKRWIGLHVWHLFLRRRGRVQRLARDYVAALNKPSEMVTFVNKVTGDAWEEKISETTADQWRACIVIPRVEDDPHAHYLGQVPPGVSYLTAGQDTKLTELHWCVWGWGLVLDVHEIRRFCGWLVDYGVVKRSPRPGETTIEAADLEPLAQLLYDRAFLRTDVDEELQVRVGYHDSGWSPLAAYGFCHRRDGRASPARGDAVDEASARRRPVHRWGAAPAFTLDGEDVKDDRLRIATLNTYVLKQDLFGLLPRRFVRASDRQQQGVITLPRDVGDDWIAHACSERLVLSARQKKLWTPKGPNHWSDCNVQAYAAALVANPFLEDMTRDEHLAEARAQEEARAHHRLEHGAGRGRRGSVRPRRPRRSY